MSLNRDEINPLNVLGLRKLSFIPEHFKTVNVSMLIDVNFLDHWISTNLNSRYAISRKFVLDQNKKMNEVLVIGIEDPKEITLLILGCPYLQHKKEYN